MATERKKYRAAEREHLAAQGYVPATEAAQKVGKSTQTVYYWLQNQKVEGVRIGTHWYVKWASLLDFYRQQDPKAVELMGLS